MICTFLGGKVLYIIRHESDGAFTLVGEALVHRIMFGEHMATVSEFETFTLR
jgi:hypothetical protein